MGMSCLFCSIVAGGIPSWKVYEDEAAFAFLDISPWHVGHTLVIPKRHVDDLTAEHARLTGLGVQFTMPPTDIGDVLVAVLDDTCGNLIQLIELK